MPAATVSGRGVRVMRIESTNEREATPAIDGGETFVSAWVTLALIALITGMVLWWLR